MALTTSQFGPGKSTSLLRLIETRPRWLRLSGETESWFLEVSDQALIGWAS